MTIIEFFYLDDICFISRTVTRTFLASVGTILCTDIVIDNEIYEESPKQLTVSLSSSHSRVTASGTVTLNVIDNDSAYNMIIIFVHIPIPQNEYRKRRLKQYS